MHELTTVPEITVLPTVYPLIGWVGDTLPIPYPTDACIVCPTQKSPGYATECPSLIHLLVAVLSDTKIYFHSSCIIHRYAIEQMFWCILSVAIGIPYMETKFAT